MAKKDFYKIFTLKNIELDETSIKNNDGIVEDELNVSIGITSEQNYSIEQELVIVQVKFTMMSNDQTLPYLNIIISNYFAVSDISQFITDGMMSIPNDFTYKLNEIATCHARGMITMILSTTVFKEVVIPLIDFAKKPIEQKRNVKPA
jgi:D-hexose-6-phosphate mutarotase